MKGKVTSSGNLFNEYAGFKNEKINKAGRP